MINKREAIIFLIEECYRKSPELMEEIPKEEMYKTLMSNISAIEAGGESQTTGGVYSTESKKISILNVGKINLEDIKKDQEKTAILAHEGVHALFRKSETETRNRFCFRKNEYKMFYEIKKSKV
ncbi:MAG: hypothetical protein U0O04_05205 [Clostridia bacterium]|jgi:hypothetical protein